MVIRNLTERLVSQLAFNPGITVPGVAPPATSHPIMQPDSFTKCDYQFDSLVQLCCAPVSPLSWLTICVFAAGIMPSDDKLLQGRVFSYSDTQRYRLGANYQNLPINR